MAKKKTTTPKDKAPVQEVLVQEEAPNNDETVTETDDWMTPSSEYGYLFNG